MPSKYEQRRQELEPKLKAVISHLREVFPGIQLDEEQIIKTQLSDARFELHERAKQLGKGTSQHSNHKDDIYKQYERNKHTPKSFARCIKHLVKEEDTLENKEYNEKFFKDLAREDEYGLGKRRQLAAEVMNISANINYESLENDMSFGNLVEYSLNNYDSVGIGMELQNIGNFLDFPFADKSKYDNVRHFGETMGGATRDLAMLAQDESFFTFPFEYLNFDQIQHLNSNATHGQEVPIPELGGLTGTMMGSYFQAKNNMQEMPKAIENFRAAFPDGKPVFTKDDFGPTKPDKLPKGGFEGYKRAFFAAADELNKLKDPVFDEIKDYVNEVHQLFKTNTHITEEQCKEIVTRRGPFSNVVYQTRRQLDSAVRDQLKPLFARLGSGPNLISEEYKHIASLQHYQNLDNAAKELFGVNAEYELKFGVSESSRVGHIMSNKEQKAVRTSDIAKVSKAETYENAGDIQNKEFFEQTARKLCELYALNPDDKALRNVIKKGSSYLRAVGRSAQQSSLKEFNASIEKYEKDFLGMDEEKQAQIIDGLTALRELKADIKARSTGSLAVPEEKEVMPEPADIGIGHIGIWGKSDDQLFPHTPSPNDIKQGLGVQDCFMLSALTHIAATNPKAITDAMKDNGDGTVSVRFFDNNKQPTIITVNKTVNKIAGANAYASSSLWVQMMEKAYIGYLNKVNGKENSFNSINRSSTSEFMNAFGTKAYTSSPNSFGSIEYSSSDLFKMDSQGNTPNHPEGYLDIDNVVYDFLNEQVNVNKETITVGVAPKFNNQEFTDFVKDHGVRVGHAYAVMKTFEKNVNGKMKKFIQLRDPYATFRPAYDKEGKLVNDSHEIQATTGAGMDNMGTFNLELVDFEKMFNSFAGLPESSALNFREKMRQCRNYADNPLSPEEIENCKLPDAPKPEGDQFLILDNAEEGSLESRLNSRTEFNAMLKQVSDISSDLASTDEWFVWTNTKKFTDMRNAVNDLEKTMKQFKDKAPTQQQFESICNKFRNAAEKASIYTEKKISEIKTNGKDPSLRAVHRLTSSFNIKRLCEGQGLLPSGKNQFSERVSLVVHDINERCERFKNNQDVPHDNKTVEQMQSFSEILTKYIADNPKLINEKILTENAVIKLNGNIRAMKVGEIKKPAPEVNKEAKPEAKYDSADLGDFEMLE